MNCRQCQKRILDALAAGETTLRDVVAAHWRDCMACQSYYESQVNLFRGLEEGLKAIANEAVPPSLVPGVRARLNGELPRRSSWAPAWGMGATAAAILTVSLGAILYHPSPRTPLPEGAQLAGRSGKKPVMVMPELRETQSPSAGRNHERPKALSGKKMEAMPEVIVLPEERAAFARFVAELPRKQETALALTRAARQTEELTTGIMALEIDGLEVASLDPAWE